MCSTNKNQQFEICDLSKLKEIKDGSELAKNSPMGRRSLQSHISDIEEATKKFLVSHSSKGMVKISESTPLPEQNKVPRSQTKSPKLIDVMSQSLTIFEYHLAEENLKDADLAISPDVEGIGFWQFHSAAQAIAAGEKAAHKTLEGKKVAKLLRQL